MCNANDRIQSIVNEYLSLKAMQEDLNIAMEALADQIKRFMLDNAADEMQSGDHIVSYKDVTSKRIDTPALRQLLGDALEPYFKVSTVKRFSIK